MPYATLSKPTVLRLAQHFSSLKFPRVAGRTDHPLLTLVVMAHAGVLCGAEGWDNLEVTAQRCRVAERGHSRGEVRVAWSIDARAVPLPGVP